jgi:hypothetical protein
MSTQIPITIQHEFEDDDIIHCKAVLDWANGDITHIEYPDFDVDSEGEPHKKEGYEFSSGLITLNEGTSNEKQLEFAVLIDNDTDDYRVSEQELSEIKTKVAGLLSAELKAQAKQTRGRKKKM